MRTIQDLPADQWHMRMRASYYRQARWHMQCLRRWMVTLEAFSKSRARQYQLRAAFDAVLSHIQGVEWNRKMGRDCLEYARLYQLDPTR